MPGVDNAFSRVVEVEAWLNGSSGSSSNIHWLVPDHLGTPRIILDQTGSFANLRRHDYLPFGEELVAGIGGWLRKYRRRAPAIHPKGTGQ